MEFKNFFCILSNRELFLGKTKDGRFYNTVLNSRIDSRKNIYVHIIMNNFYIQCFYNLFHQWNIQN